MDVQLGSYVPAAASVALHPGLTTHQYDARGMFTLYKHQNVPPARLRPPNVPRVTNHIYILSAKTELHFPQIRDGSKLQFFGPTNFTLVLFCRLLPLLLLFLLQLSEARRCDLGIPDDCSHQLRVCACLHKLLLTVGGIRCVQEQAHCGFGS